jgi:hypothetical protein
LRKFGCVGERTCGGANAEFLRDRFRPCMEGGRVGLIGPAPGATCEGACCVMGYSRCKHRVAQEFFVSCDEDASIVTGTCSDVFPDRVAAQCVCE